MTQYHPEAPQKDGEPYKIDTVEEPWPGCGVVQEMDVCRQRYQNAPEAEYPNVECPVCENDHAANPPW